MLRYLRYLFLAGTALVLLVLALANREPVTLRLLPGDAGSLFGLSGSWQVPLFLVILGAVAAGVLIGFVWEWFREMRLRGAARQSARKLGQLERELAVLKDQNSPPPRDEVLAILDEGARR